MNKCWLEPLLALIIVLTFLTDDFLLRKSEKQ